MYIIAVVAGAAIIAATITLATNFANGGPIRPRHVLAGAGLAIAGALVLLVPFLFGCYMALLKWAKHGGGQ